MGVAYSSCYKLLAKHILIPMHAPPSFLSLTIQQTTERQPEEEATQSTLWILSPRKVAYTHKVKSIPEAATYWAVVNVAYSCLPTRLIAQNTNCKHSKDKKVTYK